MATRMAATDSKVLLRSIGSGNSMSKFVFQRKHDVDTGVRRHPRLIQIVLVAQFVTSTGR